MKTAKLYVTLFLAILATSSAQAQAFPEGSSVASNEEIKKYLEDKVHDSRIADGTTWRLEYKANGHFYVNTSRGFNSDGKWQVEDGKLCGQLKGRDRTCNDVRMHNGILFYQRDGGEVIRIIPR